MSDTTDGAPDGATAPADIEQTPAAPAPVPLLQMLQLPGLPEADGDVPVCGPDGCAVPAPEQR